MIVIEDYGIERTYERLIRSLLNYGEDVGETLECNNCCLVVHRPTLDHFWFPGKKLSEDYANAELKWYWSADNSCKTIGEHAKMWLKISDDGETSNSAYGYILHKKYGFDQLQQVIELLKKDATSRRAVLNISDPTIDRIKTKDMQCTIALQFLIRKGGLEETVYMRSNDVNFGLPYDYIYFVSIGQYIAEQLGIELVKYTHHATSMHMYKKDIKKFEEKNFQMVSVDTEKIIKENYDYEKQKHNNDNR